MGVYKRGKYWTVKFQFKNRTYAKSSKYNEDRPHQSLGKLTPVEYRLKNERENSKVGWH